MNNEKLILMALRYILLKWGSTDTKAAEIIFDINKVLYPKKEKTLPERTKNVLSEEKSEKSRKTNK